MAYLSVPKISRHLTFLHLSSPLIVDNCSHIANLSFAITYVNNIIPNTHSQHKRSIKVALKESNRKTAFVFRFLFKYEYYILF